MTEKESNEALNGLETDAVPDAAVATPPQPGRMRNLQLLPGLVAISLYMVIMAGFNILGVVTGQVRPIFLVLSALFIAAGLGLLLLLRWAWALTLAAAVLNAALFFLRFAANRDFPFAIQGLLNLVFFLYLVRVEVRSKLR
ncbi:MAG: hypothetical protein ABSE51_15090 [Terracidiphilus sp.]|jgi:uncharacterized membrane protein YvlD (DUF360 family)